MKSIAIFASGAGSNAKNIIEYFKDRKTAKVGLIVSNKPEAGVINIGRTENIPVIIINREEFGSDTFLKELEKKDIDLIVLAGFLWLIPESIINKYTNRIINIHPALLPKFGGKGMYGAAVHKAVRTSGEKETGISIHLVNDKFDEGEVIFRKTCPVEESDTAEDIERRVRMLEIENYPKVIEKLIQEL